ncbi:hypothetical protein [Nonomuraea sp. NPDC023979]
MFDDNPRFRELQRIREEGYDGPLDQDLRKVDPTDPRTQVLDVLHRTGA